MIQDNCSSLPIPPMEASKLHSRLVCKTTSGSWRGHGKCSLQGWSIFSIEHWRRPWLHCSARNLHSTGGSHRAVKRVSRRYFFVSPETDVRLQLCLAVTGHAIVFGACTSGLYIKCYKSSPEPQQQLPRSTVMHFTAKVVSLAVLLTSASARPSLKEICGANPIITQKPLVAPSGRDNTLATRTCLGLASLRNTTTTRPHKRQTSQCDLTPNCTSAYCCTHIHPIQLMDHARSDEGQGARCLFRNIGRETSEPRSMLPAYRKDTHIQESGLHPFSSSTWR